MGIHSRVTSHFYGLLKYQILTLGKSSKKGPIQSKTLNKMLQEIILANWVWPPTVCWINDLDNEAQDGIQEKKDPTRFPRPLNKREILSKRNLIGFFIIIVFISYINFSIRLKILVELTNWISFRANLKIGFQSRLMRISWKSIRTKFKKILRIHSDWDLLISSRFSSSEIENIFSDSHRIERNGILSKNLTRKIKKNHVLCTLEYVDMNHNE